MNKETYLSQEILWDKLSKLGNDYSDESDIVKLGQNWYESNKILGNKDNHSQEWVHSQFNGGNINQIFVMEIEIVIKKYPKYCGGVLISNLNIFMQFIFTINYLLIKYIFLNLCKLAYLAWIYIVMPKKFIQHKFKDNILQFPYSFSEKNNIF